MKYNEELEINGRKISLDTSTYFIADIAANHDGELERAKGLIWAAKEAGADCAKFQHFKADKIVSAVGFSGNIAKVSHQAGWNKSVVEIYDQYHTKREWNASLVEECQKAEIDFMTTPYDIDAIDDLDEYLPGYKIGSGDITYKELMAYIASKQKPVLLATGASSLQDVKDAVSLLSDINPRICLMQCNTNYTGDIENFAHINLNAIKQFQTIWPNMLMGLSDHTSGHTTVVAAITLGCRVIEKHFTDDNSRTGPDHSFAMNPQTWTDMVYAAREVEAALGNGEKRVQDNELETVVIQRRALRVTRNIEKGTILRSSDLTALRPCPIEAITPMHADYVVGKIANCNISQEEHLTWDMLT